MSGSMSSIIEKAREGFNQFLKESNVYNRELINAMVTDMRENLNTEFIYLGANQDACFVAESMGINSNNAFNYDATGDGITIAYSSISKATAYYMETDAKENLFQQI